VLLLVPNVGLVIVGGVFGRKVAASRRAEQRELEIRDWHLHHLLPDQPWEEVRILTLLQRRS